MKGKLGLFFGSFDPIHNGHIEMAKLATTLGTEVRVVPAYCNIWKDTKTSFEDRLKMCQAAFDGIDSISVSGIEATLANYYKLEKVPTYMVLEHWQEWYEMTIVITRETYDDVHKWEHGEWILNNFSFLIIPMTSDIHSTEIRQRIKDGKHIVDFVPFSVYKYIKNKKLYE